MVWEVIGWIGVTLLLCAYTLVSIEAIKPRFVFQGLNILGALMVGLSALVKSAFPAATLEAAWIVIALIATIRILRKKPQSKSE